MTQRFFEITGRLVDTSGEPVGSVLLSVLDSDPISDDIIGVGLPADADGRFCVSFTREAFNQDWLEDEDLPDLVLVVSKLAEGEKPKPVFEKRFAGLQFEGGKQDLGAIEVDQGGAISSVKAGVLYDFSNVRRVEVDEEVIEHVLEEVTRRLEGLTGWRGLAQGVSIRKTGELVTVMHDVVRRAIDSSRELPWWTELHERVQRQVTGGMMASYDPFGDEIWLHETLLGQAGLDVMKAVVAHELVHVGQYKAHPELVETHRQAIRTVDAYLQYATRDDPSKPMPQELLTGLVPAFAFMRNLEGYAHYIEAHFMGAAHTAQLWVPQLRPGAMLGDTLMMRLVRTSGSERHRAVVPSQDPSDEEKSAAFLASLDPVIHKEMQYEGDTWYRQLQKGDKPAPFVPKLGEMMTPTVVAAFATGWDSLHRAGS